MSYLEEKLVAQPVFLFEINLVRIFILIANKLHCASRFLKVYLTLSGLQKRSKRAIIDYKIETTSKVSLKLTSRINPRRWGPRAAGSQLWTQPTNPPPTLAAHPPPTPRERPIPRPRPQKRPQTPATAHKPAPQPRKGQRPQHYNAPWGIKRKHENGKLN